MYDDLFKAAEAGNASTQWERKLEPEVVEVIGKFYDWLVLPTSEGGDGKAESTAKAYKGYVAQAIVRVREGASWNDLNTDIRSAVSAFIRFHEMTGTPIPTSDTDADPDADDEADSLDAIEHAGDDAS